MKKIQMQNKNFFIKAFIIALLTLLVVVTANNLIDIQQDSFQVSAEASVFAKPDLAKINFGATRESQQVSLVRQQLNQASSNLIDSLKKLDIQEKNIKTTNYSISPKSSWNRETGESYVYGYRGNLTVEVKIRDFDKIDKVVNLGQVQNISFETENKDELLAQAREEAIAKAKTKAKITAAQAGVSLGKLIGIDVSENNYDFYPKYELSADSSSSVQAGENEIKVYVSLKYEL